MSLIQKFFVPSKELEDVGLKEINMNRLGRFVALAGKNGAGKSRILNKLEFYVSIRSGNLAAVPQRKQSIVNLELHIRNNPTHPDRATWERQIEAERHQIAIALERVIAAPDAPAFKATRFVPKQLILQDPRQHPNRELTSRYAQAKEPGVNGYENTCLFYIQQLQARWWNADHQRFSGSSEEKSAALSEYEKFQSVTFRLLGVSIDRNLDGEPTIFGKPISDAGLSDGQKVILQLCVALHAQRSGLGNTVFLLDEPENHLHPSAAIDLLKMLYEAAEVSQIWIATHSIPLLAYVASEDPMALWYVNDGTVTNAGRHPEIVLDSLLGSEDRIGQLNAFTGLPAQLAAFNYALESLLPPKVIAAGTNDPQVTQIQRVVNKLRSSIPLSVLDYGAGKGRLLQGLEAELMASGMTPVDFVDYFAYDEYRDEKDNCLRVIGENYPGESNRYFNTREEFFAHKEDGSISLTVLCNVLHEISPIKWLSIFSSDSLIYRALKNDGYLLVVEDQRIPVGEKAHEYGFMVLDTSQLRTLFAVNDDDVTAGLFTCNDQRGDGRLKAHLISKSLLPRVTAQTRLAAITQLKAMAESNIRHLMKAAPTYANGQSYGFWTQQFANASLFLTDM
jgi:energy-coupling factor transporter ATP-binding protein EcfA2